MSSDFEGLGSSKSKSGSTKTLRFIGSNQMFVFSASFRELLTIFAVLSAKKIFDDVFLKLCSQQYLNLGQMLLFGASSK